MRRVEDEEVEFPSEAAMVVRLHQLLSAAGLNEAASPPCATSFTALYSQRVRARQPTRDYALLTRRWAIRVDDLALLEMTAPIAVSVAALACEPHSPAALATLVSSTLLSIVMVKHRLRQHSAGLQGLDYEVLTALKSQNGPMALDAIVDHLRSRSAIRELDDGLVIESLTRLATVKTSSGHDVALAVSSGQGAWRAGDV